MIHCSMSEYTANFRPVSTSQMNEVQEEAERWDSTINTNKIDERPMQERDAITDKSCDYGFTN